MENLYVNGRSLQYSDRNLIKARNNFENHFKFQKRIFVPFRTESKPLESVSKRVVKKLKPKIMIRKGHTEIVETVTTGPHKTRILKRPKRFKNYYTDRKPFLVTCFEFPRFGEQQLFKGRQTLCKYYHSNEIINERLMKIKLAETSCDIEKIINEQIRNRQQVGKHIQPYYDTSSILETSLRPIAKETCLCIKDYYPFNYTSEEKEKCNISSRSSKTSSSSVKNISVTNTSIDNFICLASECYFKCIQQYLNNLNDCNWKVEKRQSSDPSAIDILIESKPLASPENNSFRAAANTLANHLNRLNINLHTNCDEPTIFLDNKYSSEKLEQSTCGLQAMSSNDSNNNSTESTNHMKDPPKIIFSDFSIAKQQTQDKSDKDLSDNRSVSDKNCLSIPNTTYCSEARPP